jgi:hypothetical protein
MQKELSKITRTEWIKWQWIDVTEIGDGERFMLRNYLRTPDEAAQAAENWDMTAEERGAAEPEPAGEGAAE